MDASLGSAGNDPAITSLSATTCVCVIPRHLHKFWKARIFNDIGIARALASPQRAPTCDRAASGGWRPGTEKIAATTDRVADVSRVLYHQRASSRKRPI